MKKVFHEAKWIVTTVLGSAMFAAGFALFLQPNDMNSGGISGLAMIIVELLGFGSVGLFSIIINLPLFLISIKGVGKKFFIGSLLGMLTLNLFLTVFSAIPVPHTEPLLASLYGGLLCGVGCGLVFLPGASTGGVDILARLLRPKFPFLPIGKLIMAVDIITVAMTGVVFGDMGQNRSKLTGKARRRLMANMAQVRKDFAAKVTCPVYEEYPYGHISVSYTIDFLRKKTITADGILKQ